MKSFTALLPLALFVAFVIGCGQSQQRNNSFFTSGSREADQRADQRMARSEQLRGTGGSAGDAGSLVDKKKSLYDRLGGDAGVSAIVADFLPRVMDDPRVNFNRKGVTQGGFSIHHGKSMEWKPTPADIEQLKKHFVQFLALSTGGPAQYDGKEIKSAHAGMHVSNPEFDAAIGDLKATLDKLNVASLEQKELLSIIESTRELIVEER